MHSALADWSDDLARALLKIPQPVLESTILSTMFRNNNKVLIKLNASSEI